MGIKESSAHPSDELPRLYGDPDNQPASANHTESDSGKGTSQIAPISETDEKSLKHIRRFELGPQSLSVMTQIAIALENIEERLAGFTATADHKVDSSFVADHLGCTTVWIAEQARSGRIPTNCIVPGTGYGKPWRFYRSKIEAWIKTR